MIPLDRAFAARHLPRRPDDAHKGTMGALCSLTGSFGYSGAAILSARAALRSGVGLHYQVLPESIYPIFATAVPESVCVPVTGSGVGTLSRADLPAILNTADRASAVLIGCGMGNTADTLAVLQAVIRRVTAPLIIDADGINTLAQHIDILEESHAPVILTPHIKEFSRLTGLPVDAILHDPSAAAQRFSQERPDVVLVLKSHHTVIAQNGELSIHERSNSGLAKGGSGDVLAGIIASLTAQGAEPFAAAAAGVFIHAEAGMICARQLCKTAMLPSDVIAALPQVYHALESQTQSGASECK